MTPTQRRRLSVICLIIAGLGLGIALVLYALQQNISLFYTPTQIAQGQAPVGQLIRIGGVVGANSVQYAEDSLLMQFKVSDHQHAVLVAYTGILPDLFREEEGIVVQGRLDPEGRLHATQVLAKHDENYMPPEVAASLQKKGAS